MNRENLKAYSSGKSLNKRRLDANAQRLAKRDQLLKMIRNLEEGDERQFQIEPQIEIEESDIKVNKREERNKRVLRQKLEFSSYLSTPEWLIELPDDLSGTSDSFLGWYVVPRCEGKRCLVISKGGKTISRDKYGQIIHSFQSRLPGGNVNIRKDSTILDCIYYEPDKIYYVIDAIHWKTTDLTEMDTKFRFFWINNVIEGDSNFQVISDINQYLFKCLPYFECDAEGLRSAYYDGFGYFKDGLLFYSKASYYEVGCTPLILCWKDQNTSRYNIDTDVDGVPLADFIISLRVSGNGDLLTYDGHFVGNLPTDTRERFKIKPDSLARFKIINMEIPNNDIDNARINNLEYFKNCGFSKTFPDTWSRILFQYLARTTPITFDYIVSQLSI